MSTIACHKFHFMPCRIVEDICFVCRFHSFAIRCTHHRRRRRKIYVFIWHCVTIARIPMRWPTRQTLIACVSVISACKYGHTNSRIKWDSSSINLNAIQTMIYSVNTQKKQILILLKFDFGFYWMWPKSFFSIILYLSSKHVPQPACISSIHR